MLTQKIGAGFIGEAVGALAPTISPEIFGH